LGQLSSDIIYEVKYQLQINWSFSYHCIMFIYSKICRYSKGERSAKLNGKHWSRSRSSYLKKDCSV